MRFGRRCTSLFFLLLSVLLVSHIVKGDDEDQLGTEEEVLKAGNKETDYKVPESLEVVGTFPYNPFKTVPAGDDIILNLEHDNQNDEKEYTIKIISGLITDSKNMKKVFKQLKPKDYNLVLKPGKKLNVSYAVTTDSQMTPKDVGLIVVVSLQDKDGVAYRAVGYNGIIKIGEPSGWDFYDFMTLLVIVGMGSGAVYYVKESYLSTPVKKPNRQNYSAPKKKGSSSEKPSTSNVNEQGYDEDWIPAHHLPTSADSRKSPRSTRSRKKMA